MTAAERLAFAQGALSAELLGLDTLHCTSTGRLEKTEVEDSAQSFTNAVPHFSCYRILHLLTHAGTQLL